MFAWLRQIELTFTSTKHYRKMIIADYADGKNTLNISITGSKCLSVFKDEFTIEISNLTPLQILQLIDGQFYDIEIKIGYKSLGGLQTIFKGGITYISNNLGDGKTNTIIILCNSKFISTYGRTRLNYCLNSGINMYTAIQFLLRKSGITEMGIDPSFKDKILTETVNANSTTANWLDNFLTSNQYVANVDYSTNNVINIWDIFGKNVKSVRFTKDKILLNGGYPQLTSQGLELNVLPTFNVSPGNIIEIDNSLINITVSSLDELANSLGIYLDTSTNVKDVVVGNTYGQYVIYEMQYNLQNRGSDFSIKIIAKAKSLVKKITGGK